MNDPSYYRERAEQARRLARECIDPVLQISLRMRRDPTQRGYYVVVTREPKQAERFCWKIQRRREPMGVNLTECGFGSFRDAHIAGTKALEELLDSIQQEETRSA